MKINIIKRGVVCSKPFERFGFFGWPSIERTEDGTLYVGASGFRYDHLCPWGRSVLCKSTDDGETWSEPEVINNTPLDDRDVGLVALPGNRLALTWFSLDPRYFREIVDKASKYEQDVRDLFDAIADTMTPEMILKYVGSWIRVSPDGHYWQDAMRAPVNAPHGFIVCKDGSWMYLGKQWHVDEAKMAVDQTNAIQAAVSRDCGKSWEMLGVVPMPDSLEDPNNVHEAHVVECEDGTLVGAIRYDGRHPVHDSISMLFTESTDGGKTWSVAREAGFCGAPPHLLKHSSGALICSYGYRSKPYGCRAAVSLDNGKNWQPDLVIRDDSYSPDTGYPCSVELPGGDILTVCYQKLGANPPEGTTKKVENASILFTRWRLEKENI